MSKIRPFEMERYQSLYWHLVDHDLSESGVVPLSILELFELSGDPDPEAFLHTALGYIALLAMLEGRPKSTPSRTAKLHSRGVYASWRLARSGKIMPPFKSKTRQLSR